MHTYIYICYPPLHVPTLFGLETQEHGYFRSRTCIQVPRQSASVQPARTLWTAMENPNQGFWSCFYSNVRRNAYELNSHPREAKSQGFSQDVKSNFNRNSYKPSSYPEHDSSKSRSPDFLCHLYLSCGKQLKKTNLYSELEARYLDILCHLCLILKGIHIHHSPLQVGQSKSQGFLNYCFNKYESRSYRQKPMKP